MGPRRRADLYVADEEIRLIFARRVAGQSQCLTPLRRQTDCNMMSKTLYRAMHPSKCPYLV